MVVRVLLRAQLVGPLATVAFLVVKPNSFAFLFSLPYLHALHHCIKRISLHNTLSLLKDTSVFLWE